MKFGIEDYFLSLGDEEDPDFVFPINILYADGTTVDINSIDDLESAFDDCFYNEDDICFDITYPINLITNEDATNITTVNNDEEFDNYLEALTDDDDFDITYPLTVILEDQSNKVITSDDEFINLVDSCF